MKKKRFDAVKLMRELREKLSQKMAKMTPQERVRFIRDQALSTAFGRAIARGQAKARKRVEAPGRLVENR